MNVYRRKLRRATPAARARIRADAAELAERSTLSYSDAMHRRLERGTIRRRDGTMRYHTLGERPRI